MKSKTMLMQIVGELDDLNDTLDAVLADGRIDQSEIGTVRAYRLAVEHRVDRLQMLDEAHHVAVKHILYGDDSATQKRGLVSWSDDRAA